MAVLAIPETCVDRIIIKLGLGCLFRHVEHLFEHVEHLFGIVFTLILAILIINFNFNYFTCVVVCVRRVFLYITIYLDRPHRTSLD